MKILELFSGTKSVGKVFEAHGHEVISVDIDKRFSPTFVGDILTFNYKQFQPHEFDIIWASPPCTMFSIIRLSNIGRHGITRQTIESDIISKGLPPLHKTLEIIDYLKPSLWFIENPQLGRMKDYMTGKPYYDVCYCRYGFDYKKPTRIWTNLNGFVPLWCNHKGKHDVQIGFRNTISKIDKYRIPSKLLEDIYMTIVVELMLN